MPRANADECAAGALLVKTNCSPRRELMVGKSIIRLLIIICFALVGTACISGSHRSADDPWLNGGEKNDTHEHPHNNSSTTDARAILKYYSPPARLLSSGGDESSRAGSEKQNSEERGRSSPSSSPTYHYCNRPSYNSSEIFDKEKNWCRYGQMHENGEVVLSC
jgi:hypothetical protein